MAEEALRQGRGVHAQVVTRQLLPRCRFRSGHGRHDGIHVDPPCGLGRLPSLSGAITLALVTSWWRGFTMKRSRSRMEWSHLLLLRLVDELPRRGLGTDRLNEQDLGRMIRRQATWWDFEGV